MRLKLNPLQLVIHKFFRFVWVIGILYTVHFTLLAKCISVMTEGEVTLNEHGALHWKSNGIQ